MPQKIRKAIFPAAGLGVRFLPVTKAMPKEMLPIVDKPVIQYLVEEAVAAGIEEIIIVTGRGKRAIEDHFDTSFELEHTLQEKERAELLEEMRKIENLAHFVYVRQNKPLGDGHALLCARELIGKDEPFAVMFGDDIVDSEVPAIAQLISTYNETGKMVMGVQEVAWPEVEHYGIVSPVVGENLTDFFRIADLVEKPEEKKAPSNLAIIGKYICTPEIFSAIEQGEKSHGELRLIDGFRKFLANDTVYAKKIIGQRYDTGDKFGFLKATLDFALKREDIGPKLARYIREKFC